MKNDDNVHVVMLPWAAFGHLIPFFNLAIALARIGGIHVSFISTPKNIKRLTKVPPNLTHLVKLVEFPMPVLGDETLLPQNAEASVDVTAEKIQYLKAAYDLLQQPVEHFIADEKHDWIIADFAQHWIVDIAENYEIPIIYYSIFTAAATGFSIAATLLGEAPEILTSPVFQMLDFPSTLAYRKYEALELMSMCYVEDASSTSFAQRGSEILSACIGLLLSPSPSTNLFSSDTSVQSIFKWLDQQKSGSILFVGFGSECKPSKEQVDEIAHGLELSGLQFIWKLQKPNWGIFDEMDPLPEGFRQRTAEKGVVHIGWAPQKEILAHPSIGGSLVQGGWGSVTESLQYGHAVVVLAFVYDQGFNGRFLMEKGLGIEVERNEEGGSFTRNEIEKALTYAMVSKEGEELRVRTKEAAAIFGDQKLHDSYVASFVEYLKSNREEISTD
ncbi:hypothetical protein H5410_011892 [Solanum commersonii]|uniref:Uncharacterized protein n=1 Tax=Solanum commersonii TaxID=4109 RepID=A0A9J6AR57_SOLCO|nr:hypothetical protein H5410_011892 [Solanum commersonii]